MAILWIKGIGWDTRLRDIGWVYIFLFVLFVLLVYLVVQLVKDWKK